MHNLTAFIRFHATERPNDLAVVYGRARITYADLLDRALAAGAWLRKEGIKEGDVVALVMKNSAGFLDFVLGASHIGAVLQPINYRLAAAEVAYIHDHAGVQLVLADDELADLTTGLPRVVPIDAAAQTDIRALAKTDDRPDAVRRTGGDLYRLMYTSGTTDHPKGVIHQYDNFYWKTMDQAVALQQLARDKLLVVGPMYHVGGIDLPGIGPLMGGTLVIHRDFDAEAALQTIQDEHITRAWFAPVMTNMVLNLADRDRFDVTSPVVRRRGRAHARIPHPGVHRVLHQCPLYRRLRPDGEFGGDTLMEAGMEIEKIGSTGRAIMHVEVEICDDDGNSLPPARMARFASAAPRLLPAIGATRPRPRRPSMGKAGFGAATWAISTKTGSCSSPTARKT